ncbi:MAG: hypothetical protein JW982_01000 [Spirochaetes bacterium]|nr:hypothetical protein [Spirochaetota bacterium]
MRNFYKIILFFLFLIQINTVFPASGKIEGTWQYGLTVDGSPVGGLLVDIKKDKNEYLTSTEMTVTSGSDVTIIKYFHRETLEFKPVKSTSIITTVRGDNVVKRDILTAEFKGRRVVVTQGAIRNEYSFEEDFYISGNILTMKFIRQGMKTGLKGKIKYYSPENDPAVLIDLEEEIVGVETADVMGEKLELIHSVQKTGNDSIIDNYTDKNGVLFKSVFEMNGSSYVLVRIR